MSAAVVLVLADARGELIAAELPRLEILHEFEGPDGEIPVGRLVTDNSDNIYGVTELGGSSGAGTVFELAQDGTFTTLYNFCSVGGQSCIDGEQPVGGLVTDGRGNLYGTAFQGGMRGGGVVFELSSTGRDVWTEKVLYSFCKQASCSESSGNGPMGELSIADVDGSLYGATVSGGNLTGGCSIIGGCGVLFKIYPTNEGKTRWKELVLQTFSVGSNFPPVSSLVASTNAVYLYGVTQTGGDTAYCGEGCGTVFRLTQVGKK